ncbi:MAG: cryptochrome/photolyase family protein [Bdellovibrionales bacterium]|nr:cryptochrome/photolyase family protein [Bdellovibrionales bacterium]
MKTLHLILGDQLFDQKKFYQPLKADIFFMMEDMSLCTHHKYHKQKIMLFLSAMREFKKAWPLKAKLSYNFLDSSKSYFSVLKSTVDQHNVKKIQSYEISDHFFYEQVRQFCEDYDLKLEMLESPGFMTSKKVFQEYCKAHKSPFMKSFYKQQRIRHKILVDAQNNPKGGKWSFDEDNRKKLPKKHLPPELKKSSHINQDVAQLIENHFGDHPGHIDYFFYPTTRDEALKWLNEFFKNRFQLFGDYEDAISADSDFVYHSVLSPIMNLGLLTPQEVIDKALVYAQKNKIPMNSLEGFVRQIIGWREFIKGIYDQYDEKQNNTNFFNHKNQMAPSWYTGDTGIPILDHSIKKALDYGYAHHIERLMVLSNLMLLCEIHPKEVYNWFMCFFVDSADWVMTPNVYGMGQFSDGGIFATKPYICGSNYLLKMSDFPKGEWTDVVDGLYWRFIDKHKDFFNSNHRLSMMTRMLEKLSAEKKQRIFKAAESFLSEHTYQAQE